MRNLALVIYCCLMAAYFISGWWIAMVVLTIGALVGMALRQLTPRRSL